MVTWTIAELADKSSSLASLEAREQLATDEIQRILEGLRAAAAACDGDRERLLGYLRLVRNMVAGIERIANQAHDYFISKFDIWEFVSGLVDQLDQSTNNLHWLPILHTTLQLLSNMSTTASQSHHRRLESVAVLVLSRIADAKSHNLAACLLLQKWRRKGLDNSCDTICSSNSRRILESHVIARLCERARAAEHCDFALLCVRHIALANDWLRHLGREERVLLLDLICDMELVASSELPEENLLVLVGDFTYLTDVILTKTLGSVDQLEPEKIMQLLDILVTASQLETYSTLLKGERSLLLNTFYLLRMVQEAGKDGVPHLAPIGKLEDIERLQKDGGNNLSSSPILGFKAKLIRLLTNLTWEHKENKTLIGELEGVQLLLDCTQLDARNPCITQWAVLAVKGLVHEHPGNQSVLAGLRRVGAVDSSLQAELGVMQDQEGKIKLSTGPRP